MHRPTSALLLVTAVLSASATAVVPAVAEQAYQLQDGASGCSTALSADPVRASTLGRTARAAVRTRNDLTAAGLSKAVEDPQGWVDECGAVFYTEPVRGPRREGHAARAGHGAVAEEGSVSSDEPQAATATVPSDVLDLSSRPGSARTIYLDFTGDTTTGTAWNKTYGTTITSPAYSLNTPADATFDDAERTAIHLAWRTVAEDFAPFDVNVTTREPSSDAIVKSSLSDTTYGARVVITATNTVGSACGCGGAAYLDVFDLVGGGYYQPAWVFTDGTGLNGYNVAQTISHEVGHNFGLHHDGTSTSSYYSGAKGWAPLMGASYNKRLSQWSNGQYAGANNKEDDIAVIAEAAPLLVDDHAATATSAPSLVPDVPSAGAVGSPSDVDAFAFVASGATQLSVTGGQGVSDIDITLTILNEAGAHVTTINPTRDTAADASLHATWTVTLPDVPAAYVAFVDGTGYGDLLVPGGYDDYGSLGAYQLVLQTGTTTTQPEPPPEPTQTPTPTPTPEFIPTPTSTSVPATDVGPKPRFVTDRRLSEATRKDRYREVIKFTGTAAVVTVRGLPRGLEAHQRYRRIVLRGEARRRGQFEVQVTLLGAGASEQRTFRLRVR